MKGSRKTSLFCCLIRIFSQKTFSFLTMRCSNCKKELLKGAKFCHSCGEKVIGSPKDCPSCNTQNNSNAKFCNTCGCILSSQTPPSHHKNYKAQYPLNFEDTSTLSEQIGLHFFAELKKRIAEEHDIKKHSQYLDVFKSSGFNRRFETKASQLAVKVYTIHSDQEETELQEIDALLQNNFDALLDHFIIIHCTELNDIKLPEAILKYENVKRTEVNLETMIFDFLDLDNESAEKFYRNFLTVSENKIKNAAKSFLYADKKEMVYLLCDQTVFGSCKEGFALTEKGLYWKAHFHKAYAVHYDNLQDIKRENDWITINGRYFHVNPQFNSKMMLLLKKLKKIF